MFQNLKEIDKKDNLDNRQRDFNLNSQKKYWIDLLKDNISVSELPADFTKTKLVSYRTINIQNMLNGIEKEKIRGFSDKLGVNESVLFLSALMILIKKYNVEDKITVGRSVFLNADTTKALHQGYENILVMAAEPSNTKTIKSFLEEVNQIYVESENNKEYSCYDLLEEFKDKHTFFENIFSFYNSKDEYNKINESVIGKRIEDTDVKPDIRISIIETHDNYEVIVRYNSELFKESTVFYIIKHLVKVIEEILSKSNGMITEITMLTTEEEECILHDFNNTLVEFSKEKNIMDTFGEQVEKTPGAVAIINQNESITYADLNQKANSLAWKLRKNDIKPNDYVVIMSSRSIQMIQGIYGILKSGGAYVPIDFKYPDKRISYMLNDCKPKAILVYEKDNVSQKETVIKRLHRLYQENVLILDLNDEQVWSYQKSRIENVNKPDDAAYVIYTSGTTGIPKGVIVEHHNLTNYVLGFCNKFKITKKSTILQQAYIGFDTSIEEVFPVLQKGGKIVQVKEDGLDLDHIKKCIVDHQVNIVSCSPLLINEINNLNLDSIQLYISGGDVLKQSYITQIQNKADVYNTYGPTEATVCASYYKVTGKEMTTIPVGIPIMNTQIYILDRMQLCGIGVPGELCIAGEGVARGYLNQPDLTAEKFIQNPFGEGLIYRTGDKARWLADGNVEFLGRIDEQVKIRGYRVELGEVENAIKNVIDVKNVTVIARTDVIGNQALYAYFVGDKNVSIKDLKEMLGKNLPDYMIPGYMMQIDKIPMTKNGKVDKKALPDIKLQSEKKYEAPRNEQQKIICKIFSEILNINKVGIKDSFLELGGDSIKAIRVISRLREEGYTGSVKDILGYKTPLVISKHIMQSENLTYEQGEVSGLIELTPIMKWFFEQEMEQPNHFNQSAMLKAAKFDCNILKIVLDEIVRHHDMLRAIYRNSSMYIRKVKEEPIYELVEYSMTGMTEEERKDYIYNTGTKIQASLDITNGPLLKAALFRGEKEDHLLLAVHHLLVDGVSWRIIVEDIQNGYDEYRASQKIHFPKKTASFKEWSNCLKEYENSSNLAKEKGYWLNIHKSVGDGGIAGQKNETRHMRFIEVKLDKDTSQKLVYECGKAYYAGMNDLLLAAFGKAVHQITGQKKVSLMMEGHGREELHKNIVIDRTVGWFTSCYAIVLDIKEDEKENIIATKEMFKSIPNHGIGYGILRYGEEGILKGEGPDIYFNYLGEFDEGDGIQKSVQWSEYNGGLEIAKANTDDSCLMIDGVLKNGQICFVIGYDIGKYTDDFIQGLATTYMERLTILAKHCMKTIKNPVKTPSDYRLNISVGDFNQIQNNIYDYNDQARIEDMYELTSMQEGMLFHYINGAEGEYFVQEIYKVPINGNIEKVKAAVLLMAMKHDALRTTFSFEKVMTPVQVVLHNQEPKIIETDISDAKDKDLKFRTILEEDVKRGFDLQKDSLFRVTLVRMEQEYKMIWSTHHIITDGWSGAVMFQDFLSFYNKLNTGISREEIKTEIVSNRKDASLYGDYVRLLKGLSMEEGLKYFRNLLLGYENSVGIEAFERTHASKSAILIKKKSISAALTRRIKNLCAKKEITINTYIETAIGILLQKYNYTNDVVYGKVVSGRNVPLTGIEDIVGMFINTIPIRVQCNKDTKVLELIEAVQKQSIESTNYDYVGLADIQELSLVGSNLIRVILGFENYSDEETNAQGFELLETREQINYDLGFIASIGEVLNVSILYKTQKYSENQMEAILNSVETLLYHMTENLSAEIASIELISNQEKEKILSEFNEPEEMELEEKSIVELFEQQVEKAPDHIAVVYQDKKLTYKELNQKTNSLAFKLREIGIKQDDFVAIIADRDILIIQAIYGVLKSGAAYVPVDAAYPDSRITYILNDCKPKVILVYDNKNKEIGKSIEEKVNRLLKEDQMQIPVINLANEELWTGNTKNITRINKMNDLAYCIYTSGTTGQPKGVMVEHKGVSSLRQHFIKSFQVSETDSILQFANIVFDASVWEMTMALLIGAKLVMATEEERKNIEQFLNLAEREKISIATLPPVFYVNVQGFAPRIIITAGSESSKDIVENGAKTSRYVNAYGPTETTVAASQWEYHPGDVLDRVPIGKPNFNTRIYILNEMQLCGIGMPGEICVAGVGLARGYLNKEELTAQKFITNPFGEGKLYRTGDMARWLPDGNIEYLGRIDEQVKIRGFRIELGEIESALRELDAIKDAAVIARADATGEKAIYGYIVSEQELEIEKIKEKLRDRLPEYMIPLSIMQIDCIPMTINGKLDKRALPKIRALGASQYTAPRNKTEELLCHVFGEILGVEKVSVTDSFFELGGHSLRATRLLNKIEAVTGKRLTLKDIFQNLCVEQLAKKVTDEETKEYLAILKAREKEFYPMSSVQKRTYLIHQIDNESTAYNISQCILLKGEVKADRLKKALQKLIDRHEILRTIFTMIDGELVQQISNQVEADFEHGLDEKMDHEDLMRKFIRPFDLQKAPLLRMKLVDRKGSSLLMLDMHHIICDGMSIGTFVRELCALYNKEHLEPLALQYKDYSEWMQTRDLSRQKEYWLQEFSEDIPVLNMPLDYVRPQNQSFAGTKTRCNTGKVLGDKIRELAEKTSTTEYMIFLSAAFILLSKYSKQQDIVIGSPISARTHKDTENMLGMFVNTMAMRAKPEGSKEYTKFLAEVKESCLKAYENQEYPFEELVEEVDINRDSSRNPLFDVMLVLQNNEQASFQMDGIEASYVEYESNISQFDLTFNIENSENGFLINLEFCTDLYKKENANQILNHYIGILEQLTMDKGIKLSEIEVITEEERERILHKFNDTDMEYEQDKTVVELFEKQVENAPNQIAVVFNDESLTYKQLNEKANILAHKLREEGVKPDNLVAVLAERSIEMIIGIWGIIKAGGAYVPIDITYPKDRIEYMINDCNPKVLLTYHAKLETKLPIIDLADLESFDRNLNNPFIVNQPTDLLYVIYTSGTTGNPKGVMLENKGVVSMRSYLKNLYQVNEADHILQFANYIFDASVWEIFMALLNGAGLYILSDDTISDISLFNEFVEKNHITITLLPPQYFLQTDMKGLKVLTTGGSASNAEIVKKVNGRYRYINAYGPTENTVLATHWEYEKNCDIPTNIPIGKPISNSRIYVLDEMKLCGIGVPGELCIVGDGVARGYLNQPQLTEEKFVTNHPYGKGKLYRSGDLVRWLEDGNIEYLGRIDEQVKIRGYRIELGDIESALRKIDFITDAAVIAREDANREKAIYAYVVSERKADNLEIKDLLRETLPEYMIPSYLVQIDNIPVTRSGKLDKKVLERIEVKNEGEYAAPRNKEEQMICEIFAEILNVDQVGINNSFFELGGDSIKAIRVVSRMRSEGYSCPVKNIIKYKKPAILSKYLEDLKQKSVQKEVEGEILLTPIMKWFLEQNMLKPEHFNLSSMFEAQKFDKEALKKVLDQLVRHHDMLRAVYQNGKLFLPKFKEQPYYDFYEYSVKGMTESERKAYIEKAGTKVQAGINLEEGPLLKAALFTGDNCDYLLLAIHHFVVDGVSLRILAEDLKKGYMDYITKGQVTFPNKTTSFQEWSQNLKEFEKSYKLSKEKEYWNTVQKELAQCKVADYANMPKRIKNVEIVMDKEYTSKLLNQCGAAYHTQVNDLLIAALGMAFYKASKDRVIAINMEGHGREEIHRKVEIDRTIGWFTSSYPVIVKTGNDIRETIIATKEMFRRIPNNGLGYGVLRYGEEMASHSSKQRNESIRMGLEPDLSFNYLGEFSENKEGDTLIKDSIYMGGKEIADENVMVTGIIITGVVHNGELSFNITYDSGKYRDSYMECLAGDYLESLKQTVEHCILTAAAPVMTASDYGLSELRAEEFNLLQEKIKKYGKEDAVEDIYRLTPLQEGMLYHEMNEVEGEYFIQCEYNCYSDLNTALIPKALELTAAKHEIVRTMFLYDTVAIPVQVVLKERTIEFIIKDISKEKDPERAMTQIKDEDVKRGFDLRKDSLLRVILIKNKNKALKLIWSMHHIITDGWSSPIIFESFQQFYKALTAKEDKKKLLGRIEEEKKNTQTFKDYVNWLKEQELEEGIEYWKHLLEGYEETAGIQSTGQKTDSSQSVIMKTKIVSSPITKKIEQHGKKKGITVNTYVETAIGIVLQKYNRTSDVVYGKVVSGRNAELLGIDQMTGMFINTIPIRVQTNRQTKLGELVESIQLQAVESMKYDSIGLTQIQEKLEVGNGLIQTILAFENYYVNEAGDDLEKDYFAFSDGREQTNYDLDFTAYFEKNELNLCISYKPEKYGETEVETILERIELVLKQIIENPELKVADMELATDREKQLILDSFNNTRIQSNDTRTVIERLEEQVKKTPDKTALVYGEDKITYSKLHDNVNYLALQLRKLGVKPNDFVMIAAERSLHMLQGIYGILKAGGAYVPADPAYPQERIQYMIEDCKPKAVLVYHANVNTEIPVIDLKELDTPHDTWEEVENVNKPKDLAYCIYTSGTTGRPKGVLIEHHSLSNYVTGFSQKFGINKNTVILQQAYIGFDTSIEEIYPALINGGKIVILEEENGMDIYQIEQCIIKNQINIISCSPLLINELSGLKDIDSVKVYISGGDVLKLPYITKLLNNAKVYNTYGPTEATVCASYYEVRGNETVIPIGKPIKNAQVYIVENRKLCGIGMPGEICIAGEGIARGYLNNKKLTNEKFIQNPFGTGRLYRTGDLARWLSDGNIEYMGRLDEQVKIRGFRIELGEVDNAIRKCINVKDAAVIAKTNEKQEKALYVYMVSDEKLKISEVKNLLSAQVPAYMIPDYMMQIDSIPVTRNGKLDKKALPEIVVRSDSQYVAPRSNIEVILCKIFKDILSVEPIGIYDSFYELGGDSIKAIRVVSKIREAGYGCTVKDILLKKTAASLASHIENKKVIEMEQGEVQGEVELTPIMRWFFEQDMKIPEFYNQSIVLKAKKFDRKAIKAVLEKIVNHHDMLRAIYKDGKMYIRSTDQENTFGYYEYRIEKMTENQKRRYIEKAGTMIQGSIDLTQGPLMKTALFKAGKEEHLLIAIHHLVIDGVSWRILIEDIQNGYEEYCKTGNIHFTKKTTSFQEWAKKLSAYENSSKLLKEKNYWMEVEKQMSDLKIAGQNQSTKIMKFFDISLNDSYTDRLLHHCQSAYNTTINDLLLAAFARAVYKMTGQEKVAIVMEGHGRETIDHDIQIDRTVGWFTSLYPIILEAGKSQKNTIIATKEMFRKIPNNGFGYGVLRYGKQKHLSKELPDISFNYLGNMNESEDGELYITQSQYKGGKDTADENFEESSLIINGVHKNKKLIFSVGFDIGKYSEQFIASLAKEYMNCLKNLVLHCEKVSKPVKTASDYGLEDISISEFNGLLKSISKRMNKNEIEDIYKLSPLQEGMLFYQLNAIEGEYFEQNIFLCKGNVNPAHIRQALELLAERYEILKTEFVYKNVKEPLQIIQRKRTPDFIYHKLTKSETFEKIKEKDVKRGFNFNRDSLCRVTLVQSKQGDCKLIWSMHHIITDGWSSPILFGSFETYYQRLKEAESKEQLLLEIEEEKRDSASYGDYIRWLQKQDKEEGIRYWEQLLDGYDNSITIEPMKDCTDIEKKKEEKIGSSKRLLNSSITKRIVEDCRKHDITINSFVETAIGIILQRYNYTSDVVYGKVVSGRNADIQGVENIAGMLINTIPLRIQCKGETQIRELLKKVQEQSIESSKHDFIGLANIQENTMVGSGLIHIVYAFENYYQESSSIEQEKQCFVSEEAREQTNYDITFVAYMEQDNLCISAIYNKETYGEKEIEFILKRMESVLIQMEEHPQAKIAEINLVIDIEKERILKDFNDTKLEYVKDITVPELFENQVRMNPNYIAAVFEEEMLTYQEFNLRINSLAWRIRKKGIKPNDFVVIMAERSLEMILGIYAVLKAGGAYVPVDPTYPEERIRFMLGDCKPKALLVYETEKENGEETIAAKTKRLLKALNNDMPVLDMADKNLWTERVSNLNIVNKPEDLAYCIYTSGTTGQPKGVLIEHKGIANLRTYFVQKLGVTDQDSVLQFANVIFDASVWEMTMSLLIGAKLVIASDEERMDTDAFLKLAKREKISATILPPIFYANLEGFTPRLIITGGSEATKTLVEKSSKTSEYVNAYGPTEATVVATQWRYEKGAVIPERVPIGKPLPNTKIYILNGLSLCGIGIPGELCIESDGLAREYLNRPELTAEKFIPNPFGEGKLYRSGDLTRWKFDGNIEYMGRIDEQVKIRGFRIELGDIESVLRSLEQIRDAVAIVRKGNNGENEIYCYMVSAETLNISEVKEKLRNDLPDYMIPKYMMQIDSIPLTRNGKLNKKELPEITPDMDKEYVSPKTECEEVVCKIFGQILGFDQIGITDRFFELGGDSIKAIRIISKLHEAGYEISVKEIMGAHNIEKIAGALKPISKRSYKQGEVCGVVTATPVMEEFKKWSLKNPQHFNQSEFITCNTKDEEIIRNVLSALVLHHDILRGVYRKEELEILPYTESKKFELQIFDLNQEVNIAKRIEKECNLIQSSIDLEHGPLMKAALFQTQTETLLMICIHHLAIDEVSWRILLEDFELAMKQLKKGENIKLPKKTASFIQWAEALNDYRQTQTIIDQQPYWEEVSNTSKLGRFTGDIVGEQAGYGSIEINFSKKDTSHLLYQANTAFNTKINELLISAVGMAIHELTGQNLVSIALEGHGREEIHKPIDIDRTIGWFTIIYPVVVSCFDDIQKSIIETKEMLRQIPNNGIGYGLLMAKAKETFCDISFNYLGQRNNLEDADDVSVYSSGNDVSLENKLSTDIIFNGSIVNNALSFSITYNRNRYSGEYIHNLGELYQKNLSKIIEYCSNMEQSVHTLSDCEAEDLSEADLDMINSVFEF